MRITIHETITIHCVQRSISFQGERIHRTLGGSTVVKREDLLAEVSIEHPATSNSLFAFQSDVDVLSLPVAYLNPPSLLIELRTIRAPNANTLPTKVVLHGQTTIAYVPHVSCINSRNVSYDAASKPAFCLTSFYRKKKKASGYDLSDVRRYIHV